MGYITLAVAREPSIERVAGADHSTVGRICTHMVLWALPRCSVERLWGLSLHDLNWDSCGGVHHVAPEDTSEVKA
jgi:hypothetical protein